MTKVVNIFVLIIITLLFVNCDRHKKIDTYYENGKIKESYFVNSNGIKDGDIKSWYKNGQIEMTGSYLKNKAHGKFLRWYENGYLQSESYYNNDLEDSISILWYANGQKKTIATYNDGCLNGIKLDFRYDGSKLFEVLYVNGKKEGIEFSYGVDGKKAPYQTYKNGKLYIDGYTYFTAKPNTNSFKRFLENGFDVKFNESEIVIKLPPGETSFSRYLFRSKIKGGKTLIIDYKHRQQIYPGRDMVCEFSNPSDDEEWYQIDSVRQYFNIKEIQELNLKAILFKERIVGTGLISSVDMCLILPKFPTKLNKINSITETFAKLAIFKITNEIDYIIVELTNAKSNTNM